MNRYNSRSFMKYAVFDVLKFIFTPLGLILSPLSKWLDRHLARKHEATLRQDIRVGLPFLFSGHSGLIVPNQGVRFPPGFDYAFVTVAVGNLLIRFMRGREELDVRVAAKDLPDEWHELALLVSLVEGKAELQRRGIRDLRDASRLLEFEIARLERAFADDQRPDLRRRLSAVYADDRIATREAEWELNKRFKRA